MLHLLLSPLLACSPLTHQDHDPGPIDLGVARAAFGQARALAERDGGELWGVSMDFPYVFIDPESRACVTSHPGTGGALVERDGVWIGRFPDDKPVANATTTWEGRRWTMLIWPLPEEEEARGRLLMHEGFHNAQFGPLAGAFSGSEQAAHLEGFEGRLWLRLEATALATALQADEDGREEAAADALLFRAVRQAGSADAKANEDGLERREGSAEYTGIRLSGADRAAHVRATVALLEGLPQRPSLTRSFCYATGPALGLLLDDFDPYWREAFLEGNEMADLLAPAVWFEPEQDLARLRARALARAKHHDHERIAAEEQKREDERQERLAAYRARYLEGPVLILPAVAMQRSFNPSRIETLDGIGAVYGTIWLSADWGVANAPGGGLLLSNGTVHLPVPTDVEGDELAGDGWTLALNTGWAVVPGARKGDHRVVARK